MAQMRVERSHGRFFSTREHFWIKCCKKKVGSEGRDLAVGQVIGVLKDETAEWRRIGVK